MKKTSGSHTFGVVYCILLLLVLLLLLLLVVALVIVLIVAVAVCIYIYIYIFTASILFCIFACFSVSLTVFLHNQSVELDLVSSMNVSKA